MVFLLPLLGKSGGLEEADDPTVGKRGARFFAKGDNDLSFHDNREPSGPPDEQHATAVTDPRRHADELLRGGAPVRAQSGAAAARGRPEPDHAGRPRAP